MNTIKTISETLQTARNLTKSALSTQDELLLKKLMIEINDKLIEIQNMCATLKKERSD